MREFELKSVARLAPAKTGQVNKFSNFKLANGLLFLTTVVTVGSRARKRASLASCRGGY